MSRSDLPRGQAVAEALRVWSGCSEAGRPVVLLQGRAWSWWRGGRAGVGAPPKQATHQGELVGPSGARTRRWWGGWGLRKALMGSCHSGPEAGRD